MSVSFGKWEPQWLTVCGSFTLHKSSLFPVISFLHVCPFFTDAHDSKSTLSDSFPSGFFLVILVYSLSVRSFDYSFHFCVEYPFHTAHLQRIMRQQNTGKVESRDNEVIRRRSDVLPWGQAGFATLAAAGVDAWPIVKETAQGQLLPDRLPLILLGLQQEISKISLPFSWPFLKTYFTVSQWGKRSESGW